VHIRGTDLFIAPTLIWDNPKKAGAGKDTRFRPQDRYGAQKLVRRPGARIQLWAGVGR
jgi:hypothetical protein